ETILIISAHMPTIDKDPSIAIGASTSSLRTPMPARAITLPNRVPKQRNVMTATAQMAPVIRTGLGYSALSGNVNPDPHCLQNLRPSADSAPHVGQNISTSWFSLYDLPRVAALVNSIEAFNPRECNDGRYFHHRFSYLLIQSCRIARRTKCCGGKVSVIDWTW